MIVFDLKCANEDHVFEAWFGSSRDYEDQKARGLLSCPLCGDPDVTKALMTPAVGAKGNQRIEVSSKTSEAPTVPALAGEEAAKLREVISALATAQKKALESSTWVGTHFAEQARAMHYGEKTPETIHGQVEPKEAQALIDEGVQVAALPFPVIPPEVTN